MPLSSLFAEIDGKLCFKHLIKPTLPVLHERLFGIWCGVREYTGSMLSDIIPLSAKEGDKEGDDTEAGYSIRCGHAIIKT